MGQFDQPGGSYQSLTGAADVWGVTDCLRILRRHAVLLAVLPSVCSVGIVLATWGQGPIFEVRAMLEVQSYNEEFLGLQNLLPTVPARTDRAPYLQAELSPIQQEALLEEVGRRLLLQGRPELPAVPDIVKDLREQIRIVALKNSTLIQIAFRSKNASVAADVVRTLTETLIEKRMEIRRDSLEQTASFIRLKLHAMAPGVSRSDVSGVEPYETSILERTTVDEEVYRSLLQESETARAAAVAGQSDIRLVALSTPEPV